MPSSGSVSHTAPGDGWGRLLRAPSVDLRGGWRVKTLGLGALALGSLVLLTLVLWFREPVAAADSGSFDYRLSHDAVMLSGTRERLFALERWQAQADQPAGASVNLLIVNSDDASSRWMFPDNSQTILRRDELHASDGMGIYAPVSGLVLTVASGDRQRQSLYYYRVGSGAAVRFLTADTIISGDQVGPDRYLVIYRDRARTAAGIYSLVDFRSVAEREMPEIPQ